MEMETIQLAGINPVYIGPYIYLALFIASADGICLVGLSLLDSFPTPSLTILFFLSDSLELWNSYGNLTPLCTR